MPIIHRVSVFIAIVAGALLIAALYAPATNRVFAADHIIYFAETSHATSLGQKLAMADYELVRRFWSGEKKLFRPLLFVGLGIERHLLETYHREWNAVNLFAHLMVTLALYRFLIRVASDRFAGLLALLFGVMRSNAELVTWSHLGGYMFAFAAFLAASSLALAALDGHAPRGWLGICLLGLTLAVFTYEPCGVFTVVLVGFMALRRADTRCPVSTITPETQIQNLKSKIQNPMILLAPVLAFAAAYTAHYYAFERILGAPTTAGARFEPTLLCGAFFRSIGVMASSFVVEGALPAAVRIWIEPFQRFGIAFDEVALTPAFIANAAILVAIITLAAPAIIRGSSVRKKAGMSGSIAGMSGSIAGKSGSIVGMSGSIVGMSGPFAVAAAALTMALSYLAIIAIGRTVDNARENTYYAYLFNLFMIITFHSVVNVAVLAQFRRRMLAACLLAFIALQASLTWGVTNAIRDANAPADAYFASLATMMNASRKNYGAGHSGPDFSFRIDGERAWAVDPDISLTRESIDNSSAFGMHGHMPEQKMRLSRLLYERWWSEQTPMIILRWQDGAWVSSNPAHDKPALHSGVPVRGIKP